jgi:hypothetical protein
MRLTQQALRDRGIRRSREEIEEDARRFALRIVASLPTGRRVTEPAREFSPADAAALAEGDLDLSPPTAEEPNPLARTAARYAALLATALTTEEAAGLLETGADRVRQRLKEGTLYGVNAGNENRLPHSSSRAEGRCPASARSCGTRTGRCTPSRSRTGSRHPTRTSTWTKMRRGPSPQENCCFRAGLRRPSRRSPKSSRERLATPPGRRHDDRSPT